MRIKENIYSEYESYSYKLQKRVVEVFKYATEITELKKILDEIKREALSLRKIFWTEKELKEKNEVVSFFNARMQATVYYTLKNLEGYEQYGWKQLTDEGEIDNERDDSI